MPRCFPSRSRATGSYSVLCMPEMWKRCSLTCGCPTVYEATSSAGWTLDSVGTFVVSNAEGMQEGRWCRYGILMDGGTSIVGDIGFGAIDWPNQRAEIGYHLAPSAWGRGLATQAAQALIGWAFGNGIHRVEATVLEGNVRSERVLERAGFAREATLRDYKLVRGTFRDFSLWSRLGSS